MDGKRIISGTWGTVWENGVEAADITAFQAKITYDYQPVRRCGTMVEDRKLIGAKITGSMTVDKVYTRGADTAEAALKGKDVRKTLLSKLADPDAYGAERVALYGVSYDETVLADWAAGKAGSITIPFQATGMEFLDKIEVR